MLAERISKLNPSSSCLTVLRVKIEERQREQAILETLASARRAQQGGDLQGTLRELTLSLAAYPGDQRFIQAKTEVEAELTQLEKERTRQREKVRQLELERERIRAAEEERKKKALEQEAICANQEEQGRRAPLGHERQVVHQQERREHLHSEKRRPEQTRPEHSRPRQEDQAQQSKPEPEQLVPFGSATKKTRLFGAQTSTENQAAESRDAAQPNAGVLPLLAKKLLGYSEKEPTNCMTKISRAASLMGRRSAQSRIKKWGKREFVRLMREWGKEGGRPKGSGRSKRKRGRR